jgi:hypothetical protein
MRRPGQFTVNSHGARHFDRRLLLLTHSARAGMSQVQKDLAERLRPDLSTGHGSFILQPKDDSDKRGGPSPTARDGMSSNLNTPGKVPECPPRS